MEKIDKFVKEGKVNYYAEDAFNEISKDIPFLPL